MPLSLTSCMPFSMFTTPLIQYFPPCPLSQCCKAILKNFLDSTLTWGSKGGASLFHLFFHLPSRCFVFHHLGCSRHVCISEFSYGRFVRCLVLRSSVRSSTRSVDIRVQKSRPPSASLIGDSCYGALVAAHGRNRAAVGLQRRPKTKFCSLRPANFMGEGRGRARDVRSIASLRTVLQAHAAYHGGKKACVQAFDLWTRETLVGCAACEMADRRGSGGRLGRRTKGRTISERAGRLVDCLVEGRDGGFGGRTGRHGGPMGRTIS